MAQTTRYDLVLNGRKIGGAAQRRTAQGLLHQASLYLANPPYDRLQRLLRNGDTIVAAMQATSDPLLGGTVSDNELRAARTELRGLLNQAFAKADPGDGVGMIKSGDRLRFAQKRLLC